MNADSASKLAEVAFQYGPFFFAILFVLGVTRWAYGVFKEVATRTEPPPSTKDLAAARGVFVASFVVGILLVGASVVWWLGYRPKTFVFRGQIEDLQEYESVASDEMYFKTEQKSNIDENVLRNETFAVISEVPFKSGDTFTLEFSKNKSKRNKFQVSYDSSDPAPKYTVQWDESIHTNVLNKLTNSHGGHAQLAPAIEWTVYAAPQGNFMAQADLGAMREGRKAKTDPRIDVLQDPRSDVGSKLAVLDELSAKPEVLEKAPVKGAEPPLATLLDLTRHSDKEISYKASSVLANIDYTSIVAKKLQSSNKLEEDEAEVIFGKLDRDDQLRVVDKLTPREAAVWKAKASQLAQTEQVLATASPQGDRYYVKATWDPRNENAVSCLTVLFNTELESTRSLKQEASLMRGRRDRLAYWYDKSWAPEMARRISLCGGVPTYVHLPPSK